jgi:outer membrane protein
MPVRIQAARAAAFAAVAIAAALPAGAGAQSLLELYDLANGYDATYLAARALAESAPYRVEQTRALKRPSASLVGSATRDANRPTFGDNYTSNTLSLGVSGRQPLFNRLNDATIAQAERSLVASVAELDAAQQDLILRLSQTYFDVLAAQDAVRTTGANKAAISEQLASARRNFEVGTATITDTREAQARFDLATAQEIQAGNDLLTRRIALDQLVGRPNVEPRRLAEPATAPPPAEDEVETLVSRALEQHPSVRRAAVAFEVAQLETERARAQALPTVDAIASAGAGRGSISANITGNRANASVGVQINVPLWTGGSIQNRIKETLVLEERARQDLEATRRAVAQSTRQAFYTLRSGAAQVRALEAAQASSRLALEATQTGYRVGVRVNVDVLNAQSQLFQTERDLFRARYDVLVNTLRLRQAAGALVPTDIVPIDRLLAR